MQSKQVQAWTAAALVCALPAALFGCDDKKAREKLPDWSDGYETAASDSGVVEVDAGVKVPQGGFALKMADDVEYPYRLYQEGTTDSPCAIELDQKAHNDIRCILDMDELDLFVLGFKLNVITPKGGCDFVLYQPYMYASWPVGTGATEVEYTKHADGSFTDEKNSVNGVPICETDYLYRNGPNCCSGMYTLTETNADTGDKKVSRHSWGGPELPECYDGGGWLLKDLNVPPGSFPPDPIYYVDRKHTVIPIEEQGFSDKYIYYDLTLAPTNVQLANYWESGKSPLPKGLTAPGTRPDYTFLCLDDAEEIEASIRLQVREWNEELQFDTRGNPDTIGEELEFPSPVNDILDWKDLADLGADHNLVKRVVLGTDTVDQRDQGGENDQR